MKLFIVDAFTDCHFKGNPAAVCLLEQDVPEATMQNIAMEMNLSETAFLRSDGAGYALRWFTPATEVSLCGHATLASAHVLWEHQRVLDDAKIRFQTLSGELLATKKGEWIELDFPARRVEAFWDEDFIRMMDVSPVFMGRYRSPKGDLYFLELENESAIRDLAPDFQVLSSTNAAAVIVTAKPDTRGCDFVSRFFAPAMGINEDPVTGSAHCSLAPYWTQKLGKTDLTGLQLSLRTGIVKCRWEDDRVFLMGMAKTFLAGKADLK